jgi:hypothetical protein
VAVLGLIDPLGLRCGLTRLATKRLPTVTLARAIIRAWNKMLSAVAALPARRRSHGGGNAATLARFDARPLRQKACRKADPEAKAVAVSYGSAEVLADASEITSFPKPEAS